MIDHSGKIHYKDLGQETENIVKAMSKYNLDFTWDLYIDPKDRPKGIEKREELDLKIED
jgi:hypothetical protein